MAFSVINYALANKGIESALSGVSSYSIDGTDLVITLNDGTELRMTFPTPLDGKSLEFKWNDDGNRLGVRVEGDTNYVYSSKLSPSAADIIHIGNDTPTGDEILWVDTSDEYAPPKLTLTLVPSTELYDKANDTLASITPTVNIVKGTDDIQSVQFFIDGVAYKTITQNVADGGTFSAPYTFPTPTNETFAVKVTAVDKQNNTVTKNVIFVGESFYGTVPDAINPTNITETDILALNSVLKNSKILTYQHISVDYGRVVYAYPKALGALNKIVDQIGTDYTGSYTMLEIVVNGLDYYCYILTDSMGTNDAYQKFN